MGKTNLGYDIQSAMMGGAGMGTSGTATAVTSTTLTDSTATWSTNAFLYKMVVVGSVYGVIISNTGTILTVDRWSNPATPGSTAATTPSVSSTYTILPGAAPAMFIGLSASTTPTSANTSLSGEITTTNGGLIRKICPYAHTSGANPYTLTPVFTANSSDVLPVTIGSIGVFQTVAGGVGQPLFTTQVSPTATLSSSGDQLTITETVTL